VHRQAQRLALLVTFESDRGTILIESAISEKTGKIVEAGRFDELTSDSNAVISDKSGICKLSGQR
jgi:hypothetical protein